MNKFPLFFDINEIKKYSKNLKYLEDKAAFFNYHFSVIEEIFNHESDDDFKKYIEKYNLVERMPLNQVLVGLNTPKITCSLWIFNRLKYKSISYRDLHLELANLHNNLRFMSRQILLLNYAFDAKNNFSLNIHNLDDTIDALVDDDKIYAWLSELLQKIEQMLIHFSPSHFRLLKKNFKYDRMYHNNRTIYTVKTEGFSFRKSDIRLYLKNELIYFLKLRLNRCRLNLALKNARKKYPDNFDDDNDKYPVLDYDYYSIQTYSNEIFKTIEEKAIYFLFLINSYEKSNIRGEEMPEDASLCIYNLRKELENYKDLININYLKNSVRSVPTLEDQLRIIDNLKISTGKNRKRFSLKPKNPIIPKSKEDPILIRHYYDIAKKYEDVPKLKHLETSDFSKSFWSKKLNDIFFLTKIYTLIELKLEDGKINDKTRQLLLKLRNDINSRIPKAQEKERKKTSYKSSKQNSVSDEYEDESAYDRSQYYDKSPDE